ncbi:MAG: LysR family transcriptional regulator [Alcaligenaceae bacterium]|nr:LysR family transcriptional regulator [Alcaligenaceae bacterium]
MVVDPCRLNLRHLRALMAIQDSGSISGGAHASQMSQSGLTQGIAKLESQIKCILLERQPDGINMTPNGELALVRIRAGFKHLDDALHRLDNDTAYLSWAITMTHVRALTSLTHVRSYAAAAAASNMSQTAVHRAIVDLERLVNKSLVDRRAQGTSLSFAGRLLARGFRLLCGELRAMLSEISGNDRIAPISIGALSIARPYIVPTAIAQMVQENPKVRFSVAEGSWEDLVEQLQDGVLDIVIGVIHNPELANLRQEPLSDDRVVILCGHQHPLANEPSPSLESLAKYPWIVAPQFSALRAQWETLFNHGPLPECPVECESIMVIINLLAQSQFLTLASPRQVELPMQTRRLAQIKMQLNDSTRSVGLITRKSWQPTVTERRFIQLLKLASNSAKATPITMK